MRFAARLNEQITQLAVGRHLPYRTVRTRLTLLYGGLFLLSGAALMAITYALLVHAGFVFSLQNVVSTEPSAGSPSVPRGGAPAGFPAPGSATHPTARTLAVWSSVARCMRQNGVSGFPDPTTSLAPNPDGRYDMIADRDGAILAIPATVDVGSQAFTRAATTCGFMPDYTKLSARDSRRRTQARQELLLQSGIALAGMSLLSLALGWLMAGRVLQPLEDSYDAQRQFVANASHELRAPLTRMRALSEVALAGSNPDVDSLRRAHERVLAAEQHLEQLIDALLALTRGHAGLERREHVDLATITSQTMLTTHESQLAGLDLALHATLDAAPTTGDPRLLERLVTNLIDNAIRHNTRGGHVEITTGTRDRHAFVSVANTGPAVPPGEIDRLFQPFQRLSGTRAHHSDGHGLGLSVVQAIAAAHHAEVTACARPEGGLTIEASFPPVAAAGSTLTLTAAVTKRGNPRPSLPD